MTLLKPTLFVRKLKVFQGGHEAFNCEFHKGVNVLRGRNSSGKTTIMDLLAFSLGAENIRWKPEALRCTSTFVEVELNGNIVCLKRDISTETLRPMNIYWGSMDKGMKSGPQEWEIYPFKRSTNKINFTQAIFNALDIPMAQGDGASNLTMHQILRVLYADQPSVHSPIFRIDNFDSSLTREIVGGYLCGVFNDKKYSDQIELRNIESLLSKKISELKSIFTILGKSGQNVNLDFIDEKITELENNRNLVSDELKSLKINKSLNPIDKGADKKNTDSIRTKLNKAKSKELSLKDEIESLELEIADSQLFIDELENRLQGLDNSETTRKYFHDMQFQFCPSCLTELSIESHSDNCCHLCKTVVEGDTGNVQMLRMKNEISLQIKESKSLIDRKVEKIKKLNNDLPGIRKQLRKLEKDYDVTSSTWDSSIDIKLEELSRKIGMLDEEIKQAYANKKLSSVIKTLQVERDTYQNNKNRLELNIKNYEAKEEEIKVDISETMNDIMVKLLKKDLPLQKEFIEAKNVNFNFVENTVYVNGSRNFSESSAVVLRHIFHLSLLSASMKKEYMRVPKFIMLDGIDDGGMEKGRSHNLQKIIVDECSTYENEYQLIYATSEINPYFEGTNLVVGRSFTPESRSLNLVG